MYVYLILSYQYKFGNTLFIKCGFLDSIVY